MIELVDCDELLDGKSYEGKSNNIEFNLDKLKSLKHEFGDLCPLNIDQLKIKGQYGDKSFNYISIEMLGCNQDVCLSDSELTNTEFNIMTLRALPNQDLETMDTAAVSYTTEASYYKRLWPEVSQRTNMFYMRSSIEYNTHWYDIFDQKFEQK